MSVNPFSDRNWLPLSLIYSLFYLVHFPLSKRFHILVSTSSHMWIPSFSCLALTPFPEQLPRASPPYAAPELWWPRPRHSPTCARSSTCVGSDTRNQAALKHTSDLTLWALTAHPRPPLCGHAFLTSWVLILVPGHPLRRHPSHPAQTLTYLPGHSSADASSPFIFWIYKWLRTIIYKK